MAEDSLVGQLQMISPRLATKLTMERLDTLREIAKLRDLLREVACAGVELDDPRIGYVTIQIDRETWQQLQARRALGRDDEDE